MFHWAWASQQLFITFYLSSSNHFSVSDPISTNCSSVEEWAWWAWWGEGGHTLVTHCYKWYFWSIDPWVWMNGWSSEWVSGWCQAVWHWTQSIRNCQQSPGSEIIKFSVSLYWDESNLISSDLLTLDAWHENDEWHWLYWIIIVDQHSLIIISTHISIIMRVMSDLIPGPETLPTHWSHCSTWWWCNSRKLLQFGTSHCHSLLPSNISWTGLEQESKVANDVTDKQFLCDHTSAAN